MHCRYSDLRRSVRHQRGFVLITALIFLLVLVILGTFAIRYSTLEERIANNERERSLARQAAEMAIRDAELDILGRLTSGAWCQQAGGPNCRPDGTRPRNLNSSRDFWTTSSIENETAFAFLGFAPNCNQGGNAALAGMCTSESAANFGAPVWRAVSWTVANCGGRAGGPAPVQYGTFTNATRTFFNDRGMPLPQYIIEMFTFNDIRALNPAGVALAPQYSNRIFFRITACGMGRTQTIGGQTSAPATILQTIFSPTTA
jgi:type IV pilus assembly protein PilX